MIAPNETHVVRAGVRNAFRSSKSVRLPAAWAIPEPPAAVVFTLLRHGIEIHRLDKAIATEGEVFVPSASNQASFRG